MQRDGLFIVVEWALNGISEWAEARPVVKPKIDFVTTANEPSRAFVAKGFYFA